MCTRSIDKTQIISWVEKSIENEHLKNCNIRINGTTDNDAGYVGEILFVTVSGTTQNNEETVFDLVIKHGKNNSHLRKVVPFRSIFLAEIYVYDKIFPTFKRFQREKNISNGFGSVPKCYTTLTLEEMEVIVFENLLKEGYELHDRTKPLNVSHLKLILENYGKFHALSFAFRDQNREEFNQLVNNLGDTFKMFFDNPSMIDNFNNSSNEALDLLNKRGDTDLQRKMRDVTKENGTLDLMFALLTNDEPQSVILHGDCWNNNFMFKYESEDKSSPSQVRILDWQVSALRSPVFDLSYVLYANSSGKELESFDELLETYYSSFSSFLRKLGSDPEKLFTFDDLRRHWKKYSLFGVLFMPTLLKFALCKRESAPALGDLKEDDSLGNFMSPEIGDMDAYYQRLKAVYTHYFESTLVEFS